MDCLLLWLYQWCCACGHSQCTVDAAHVDKYVLSLVDCCAAQKMCRLMWQLSCCSAVAHAGIRIWCELVGLLVLGRLQGRLCVPCGALGSSTPGL